MPRLLSCALVTAPLLMTAPVFAQPDCPAAPAIELKKNQAESSELGGHFVLKQFEADETPFLVKENCITLGPRFWRFRGRFIFLGLINYVPGEDEPDTAYLGVQAVRANPRRDSSDRIRVFRNSGWVIETAKGFQSLRRLPGRTTKLGTKRWDEIHANTNNEIDITAVNRLIGAIWHAQPAEDIESSWELNREWMTKHKYEGGTLATYLLIRFSVNRDPKHVSIVPFQVSVPPDAEEIIVSIHSNIESYRKTVKFRFSSE